MSLRKKAVSGVFWTFSQQLSVQVISFIVQLIIARILLPEAFGLVAMLQLFIAIGDKLTDSGMTSSLLRTNNADNRDYSTVFFMNIGVSLFIYAIIFFCAPFISDFYNQPVLTGVVRLYAVSIIIQALISVQMTRLTKQMNFKLQMKLQIPAFIGGGIVGVVLAYAGYGVWSLVWLNLSRLALQAIQYWIFTDWRPEMIIDRQRLQTHFSFGYKLTLSGVLDAVYNNLYNILIGRFFLLSQLGYYERAYAFQQLPVQTISASLNKVTYPMFAALQDDTLRLRDAYKRLMQVVIFLVAPLMVILSITAEPLFSLILTEKWVPAAAYFQILCLSGILYPLHAYNLNILNVKGRSDLFLKLEVVKKLLLTGLIFCAFPFGIYGLLYVQLIITVLAFFINGYFSGRLIHYSSIEQLKDITPVLLITAACGILTWLFHLLLVTYVQPAPIVQILLDGVLFGLLYTGASVMLKIPAINDFKTIILRK